MLTNPNYKKVHKEIFYINRTPEAVKEGEWKLRRTKDVKGAEKIELFNLSWDPSERVNLAESQSIHVKRLLKVLDDYEK